FSAPDAWRGNSPQRLRDALAPLRADGTLPDYPLGSDFTPVEQRLARALAWLKDATATRTGKFTTVVSAVLNGRSDDRDALQRMDLEAPQGVGEWIQARLLGQALARTARSGGRNCTSPSSGPRPRRDVA